MSYAAKMARASKEIPRGTKVGVPFGGEVRPGFVTEDRGILAKRHIVRVRLDDIDDLDALEYEVPVDELQPAPPAA